MQIYKTHADYATFSVKKPPRTFVRSGFRSPAHENAVYFASERIRRLHLPPDTEAVALAMAAGDQTELTPERRAPYARTGTAHVLAVSGLHVGMVFLYVNLLLGALALLHRGHLLRNAAAIAVIWLFAAAAGLSPGTIRAAVMFTALQLALATTSRYAGVNILSAAAFGMLLWRPSYLFHVGFQLSFLSVAAILLWGIPLYRRLRTPWRRRTPRWDARRRRGRLDGDGAARILLFRADPARRTGGQSARHPAHLRGGRGIAAGGWRSPGRPFRSSSVRCSKGCCGCKTGWSPKRPPCPVPRSTTG